MDGIRVLRGVWFALVASSLSAGEEARDLSLAGAPWKLSLSALGSCDGSGIAALPDGPDDLGLAPDQALIAGRGGDLVSPGDSRVGRAMLKGGIGFTSSPSDFLLTLEADYFFTNGLAVGPLFQLGLWDDPFIFAPTLNFKGVFDLPEVRRLKPLVEGGLGLAYMDADRRHGGADDTGFLLDFGGGLQYFVDDRIAVGSEVLFNFVPGEVLGDHFFFSWQLVTLNFLF
jgi:hypothetical protein